MTVEQKIKDLAIKAANEEAEKRKAEVDESVQKDLVVINKILQLVKHGLVYKNRSKDSYRKDYCVVTEDILFEDYTGETPGYGGGTSITRKSSSYYDIEHTSIKVNGHQYYHAKDVFARYEHELKKLTELSENERRIRDEKKYALDDMKAFEPLMKLIMLSYDKVRELVPEEKELY